MSSYIIAGSADSLDTAYCQELARIIKAKYKNIDFRVVIKHPSEWEEYLNQICRIYGFPKKSNPIIYTYHGKIIGNKDAFVKNANKYFGLSEQSLVLPNISTAVNIKLANEQLQRKNIIKNNIKTLQEKISSTYDKLLKQGTLKHELKVKNQFLINGIQYYFREVTGLCPSINFPQNLDVKIQRQNIEASDLNLMALSLQDQIPADDAPTNVKEAFVTNQTQQAMERMSQASKTNRLHSSVMSKDEDSKINKQSSQDKHKIDQQFDDVTDYIDINMESTFICDLGDHFCLAYERKGTSQIPGQMIFYYNEAQSNGNVFRMYNDGRPVIGHHTLVKQIHYMQQVQSQKLQQSASISKDINDQQQNQQQDNEQNQNKVLEGTENAEPKQEEKEVPSKQEEKQGKKDAEKEKASINKVQIQDQALSQGCSDLNLVSNLNYHTLYILKPLSSMQLRYLLYLVRETNTVACLQFFPQNPNPRVKVYNRGMLLQTKDSLFPIESFIQKQLEDGEFEKIALPKQQEQNSSIPKISFIKINELNSSHLYFPFESNLGEEELAKVLKIGINDILNLEEALKKEIGYNLVITKKYVIIFALTEPYRVYGTNSLYFDGLAYLGYVQIAKVVEGYMLKPTKIDSGQAIRDNLASCSGFQIRD